MKRRVRFGVAFESYGYTDIEIPDDLDVDGPNGRENLIGYIRSKWDDIPLPSDADYVAGSDELDEESDIEVYEPHH